MIIETSDNRFYNVRDTGDANLAHVWFGTEVKRTKAGYVAKAKARETLVRKAGCKFINASFETVEDFGRALAQTLPAA